MARWNEADHPRDDRGRFGHGHGSDTPNSDGASNGGQQRGMPAAISSTTVKLRNGETITIDRHPPDGKEFGAVTLHTEHGQVTYEEEDFNRLVRDLSLSEDWPTGESDFVQTTGHITETGGFWNENIALIERTGSNTLNLHLRDDEPDFDELRATPAIRLTDGDVNKLDTAHDRSLGAYRVDTGNGDIDLAITDDNKFVIRHLGDDGTPVETKLDARSFSRINQAINVVYEGFDESEKFIKGDAAWDNVTRLEFNTNAGKVRVERIGDYRGTNPGDRLEVMAVDESWGIVVDGDKQDAFDDAMSEVENVAEGLNFYDRLMD